MFIIHAIYKIVHMNTLICFVLRQHVLTSNVFISSIIANIIKLLLFNTLYLSLLLFYLKDNYFNTKRSVERWFSLWYKLVSNQHLRIFSPPHRPSLLLHRLRAW